MRFGWLVLGFYLGRQIVRVLTGRIRFETSDVETGVWCTDCDLPSAVRSDALLLIPQGVITIASVTKCHDCGHMIETAGLL